MANNIQIDDKRYRYFITDKDRAKRIFKKGSKVILEQLAKDTQHKLNKLNEKWYNTGSASKYYIRVANSSRRGVSILKNNGYRIIQNEEENILNIYYQSKVTSKDNPAFGGSTFGRGIEKRGVWTPHGQKDTKKSRFTFAGYVDFIENGGEGWVDTSPILKNRAEQIHRQATHATEKLYEWYRNEVQTAAFRNELYEVTRTSLLASFNI